MKKLVLIAMALFCSIAIANPLEGVNPGKTQRGGIGGTIDQINDSLDALQKTIEKIRESPIGRCYDLSGRNYDICSLVPDLEAGLNVCSLAPNIPGLHRRGSSIWANTEFIREYCANRSKYEGMGGIGSDDSDIFILGQKRGGGRPYDAPGEPGDFKKIIAAKSPANTALLQFDQEKLDFIKGIAKSLGRKNIDTVTIDDIVGRAPANTDEYYNIRFLNVQATTKTSVELSPYKFSVMLSNRLKNTTDVNAMRAIAEQEVLKVQGYLEDESHKKADLALKLAFNKEFLATPTREYIDILREDVKIENVFRINKRMWTEAKILSDANEELAKKNDLISLTAEKAIIMNTKFDAKAAREEIEALIR